MVREMPHCSKCSVSMAFLDARIKGMVRRLNRMQDLLFEVKCDTARGKMMKMLLNLAASSNLDGFFDFGYIASHNLADLLGISHTELRDCLKYLEQQGILVGDPGRGER